MYQLKIAPTITNREGEALERYLQDIGRAEMISPEIAPAPKNAPCGRPEMKRDTSRKT